MNNTDSFSVRLYKHVVVGPSIFSRIFWFILGAPMSLGVNWGIFTISKYLLGLTEAVSLAISFSVVTVFFSLWNFFVNFRTSRGNYGESLPRYVTALGVCQAVNYSITLMGIKQITHDHKLLELAVMAGSTFLVSGLKFSLYHFWVYPHTPTKAEAAENVMEAANSEGKLS